MDIRAFSTTALSHSANLHVQPFCCGFFRLGKQASLHWGCQSLPGGAEGAILCNTLKAQCGATTLGDDPPSLALLAGGRSSKCGRQAHGVRDLCILLMSRKCEVWRDVFSIFLVANGSSKRNTIHIYESMYVCNAMWCNTMQCNVMQCNVMLPDVMSCHIMSVSCHVMSCDVMLYQICYV